jgi:hypothetical protein
MNLRTFRKLYSEGLISGTSFEKIRTAEEHRLFSLHRDLSVLLYLGVLLLSGGLGILIYEHIDTIGHQAVLAFIAAVSAGCFYYCYRKKAPFSWSKVTSPDTLFDYLLLLGCLTLVTFITYLQYQYAIFGDNLRLASFVPMVILFGCAYFFDHRGVLTLAIINLATWFGIVVTPTQVLQQNDFHSDTLIYTGMSLGVLLIAIGQISARKRLKPHFSDTYLDLGAHILFIACLAGLFHFDDLYLAWFFVLVGIAFYFYRQSHRDRSFYYLLILSVYTYIGLGYVMFLLIQDISDGMPGAYLLILYFIGSAVATTRFLIHQHKKIKGHDSIQ